MLPKIPQPTTAKPTNDHTLILSQSLNSTMLYIQLISFKDDDFSAVIAHSQEEACKLIEAGFEYVCDFNGNKIFKKT